MLAAAALLLLLCSHPLVQGDGLAYFMYLDSVAGDGDLDLSNQAERFAAVNRYHLFPSPVTGAPVTSFPFGSAVLLAPFYWLARALLPVAPALNAHPEHFQALQALPLAYSLSATLGALLYALAAVWLAYRAACRVAPAWTAALAAVACLAGTPLLYYTAMEPLDTHVYGAFTLALALWLGTREWKDRAGGGNTRRYPPQQALLVGLALGLAVVVRWQLLLYALPAGALLVWRALSAAPRRQALRSAGAFLLGLSPGLLVCGWYFWQFFGSPFVIPNEAQQGQAFMDLPLRYLRRVLVDPHKGWLTWSPVAGAGLAGLVGLGWTSRDRWRAVAAIGLAGIALELALNSSLHDWFAGWAFGQRRMTEAYGVLVVGMAWLLGRGRPRWLMIVVVLLAAAFGLLLLAAHIYYTHTGGEPAGGPINVILPWLFADAPRPTLWEVWRERYGPWAWSRPQL
jgi:hypothetical protein